MTLTSRLAGMTSRRDFLTANSMALAGTLFGSRTLTASVPVVIPRYSPYSADAFLAERISAVDLHALVARALDATRSTGVTYADIRIAERHVLEAELSRIVLTTHFTYGVRALVNGAWGFAYGRAPTGDAVVQCAQDAVSSGRVAAQLSSVWSAQPKTTSKWVPAPVAIGEWRTPIQVDPFTVPVQQHAETHDAIKLVADRVPKTAIHINNRWLRETRVVGATTGTLVTQYLYQALPWIHPDGQLTRNSVEVQVPAQQWAAMGYERLLAQDLLSQFKAALEEATRLVRLPMRELDVGRYPVVFDGHTMGTLLGTMIGPSLELDRVLGSEVEASGASRLSMDLLGTPIASPLLTVVGNRTVPSVTAVQWDDEGSVPQEHTVIKDGVLMDYHTSNTTVGALTSWYQQHGQPLRAHGCAVAPEAKDAVMVRAPHLVMQPNTSRAPLDDLCKEMRRGIVVLNAGWITTDQQLGSGSISPWSELFEVSRGQIVRRLKQTALQFNILPLLKGLAAVGDSTTLRPQNVRTSKGMPWVTFQANTTAPATLFKEINAISTHA